MANLRSINYWNSALEEADNNILTINYNREGIPTQGGRIEELHPPAKPAVRLFSATYPTQAQIDEFFGSKNEFLENMFWGVRVAEFKVVTALINLNGQGESVQGAFSNHADADGVGGAANSKGTIMPTNRRCTVKAVLDTNGDGTVPLPVGIQRVFLHYPFSGLYLGDTIDVSDSQNFMQNNDMAAQVRRVQVSEIVDIGGRPTNIAYDVNVGAKSLGLGGVPNGDITVAGNWYNNAGGYSFLNLTSTTVLPMYTATNQADAPLNRLGISKQGNIAVSCFHNGYDTITSGPSTLSIYWRSK
tara:strand:+ start:6019 stop:6921 length:903 start_codon:yes stop_codon:yes gene_type:complete